MPIYDRPTKTLMLEFVDAEVRKGQAFKKEDAVRWFKTHYPRINPNTIRLHVEGMATNSRLRKHHRNIKPGSGHDLFYKLGPDQFRLWDANVDPAPRYFDNFTIEGDAPGDVIDDEDGDPDSGGGGREFAFERDLRNYLVRNLTHIESGLRVYEEDEISGVEFPVGGRFIDILAVDRADNFVVIELKVSRGYDRTIGQLLRYMGWVDANLAEGRSVRGIIVASNITEDLKLAASRIPDVKLVEYEIAFSLRPIL